MPPAARVIASLAMVAAGIALVGSAAQTDAAPSPRWAAPLPSVGDGKDRGRLTPSHCRRLNARCIEIELRRTRKLRDRLGCDHQAVFATTSLVLGRIFLRTLEEEPGVFRSPAESLRERALTGGVYLDTLAAYDRGEPVPPAWEIAFKAAREGQINAAQDMLLGLNAQIQNDLPFVTAALGATGDDDRPPKPDFRAFKAVLDRAFEPLMDAIASEYEPGVSNPNWSPIDGKTWPKLVHSWRRAAWRSAKKLAAAKDAEEQTAVTKRIATKAARTARAIAAPEEPGHRSVRDAYCAGEIEFNPETPGSGEGSGSGGAGGSDGSGTGGSDGSGAGGSDGSETPPDPWVPGQFEGFVENAEFENSADEVIFWANWPHIVALTDAELDAYKAMGVDGFVCNARWLRGMGGTQDFTGDPNASLEGPNYELQRSLRDSRIAERMDARGMKIYLGAYFVNDNNSLTPLKEWYDDVGWSEVVLPRIRDLAAAANQLGFDGVAIDQELYGQHGGATWNWDYGGHSRPEADVRAQARRRGAEVMRAILEGFPNVDLPVYHVYMPGTWGDLVYEQVHGKPDYFDKVLDPDFLAGMLSVEGYDSVRIFNAMLQKSAHTKGGNWDAAMQYESNQVLARLSREVSNWDYASSRLHWMPFSWLNPGPRPSAFDDAKPVWYVERQLQAMRRWGMGGMFANYVWGSLQLEEYQPYESVLRAASTPGRVDPEDPTLALTTMTPHAIEGTAHDDLTIRAVRWQDDRGRSGTADMTWEILAGDPAAGYEWQMRWSLPVSEISPNASQVMVVAEDAKGQLSSTLTFSRP